LVAEWGRRLVVHEEGVIPAAKYVRFYVEPGRSVPYIAILVHQVRLSYRLRIYNLVGVLK
jgi:hypothetical protein